MSPQLSWYVARATGYVAWALLTSSVITGLLFSARLTRRHPTPAWVLDLHRFLAGAAVAFTGLHIAGLVADNYVHFGVADVLVPYATGWRTGAVALGIVAMYLLAAVEISSLLMRRLPRRLWRSIHLSSFVSFWLATFHLLTAGTDAENPASKIATAVVVATVVFLTLVRVTEGRGGGRRRRAPAPRTSPQPEADREVVPAGRRTALP
jgi:predicted ferric reductase